MVKEIVKRLIGFPMVANIELQTLGFYLSREQALETRFLFATEPFLRKSHLLCVNS